MFLIFLSFNITFNSSGTLEQQPGVFTLQSALSIRGSVQFLNKDAAITNFSFFYPIHRLIEKIIERLIDY